MHFVIFTSPSANQGVFVTEAIKSADKVIAADCGLLSALALGIKPEVVIGDFDSLDQPTIKNLQAEQIKIIKAPAEKDETDTQLAIAYAIKQGATRISLVGGIAGNRFEHAVANISLTCNPEVPVCLVDGPSRSWVTVGPQTIDINGTKDNLLSLLALSWEVTSITTSGLYYPLSNESLYFGVPRGMSNVFTGKTASVAFKNGILMITHTINELTKNA
jgi:thiamine pyrophosphokinase